MSKWLRFLLRGGVTNSGLPLLSKASLDELWLPHMPQPHPMNQKDIWKPIYPVTDILMSYNLGFTTNIYRGNNVIFSILQALGVG